ncbi:MULTISPECIES: DUF2225 domain-containing protein [Aneurinibacillus]|uniref:DUF2225 domain-containing protein n=1 Tax=Aneurinibacillus thermoaerophilus TaxID=143495 RepID=A0A1G8D8T0_ANETH|nr:MULTISPECIES: DUF2225 domain-containing protein [Aneurinibacillus]AMA72017.1 hypothetical protein ACH33_03615 [Aneurinibacillus sp. XH2]MED0677020.1 DUF2225 domain-containing protein [Aneurinibacillus thermoaerophilus]MED0679300.1 DUF2225 domain-containing protein [Aneurinibacillus thermoaerophilus]MED0737186.1 DUF2225 domain-containing protein [Aneurinibacillus thermoaerophilus]MED0757232.1 DUF2225 domain-containing protein [Aneurinibacillus thermoaerophilus]
MNRLETILYDKKFSCAHCGHNFTSKKTRLRRSHPYKRDPDFCEYYEEQSENPILYHVVVCPRCGYSFNDQFRKKVPQQIAQLIEEKITANWTQKDYTGIRTIPEAIVTYKLAIFTANVCKEPHCVIAGLCLRLAWLYRYLKHTENERRFLKLALSEYEASYERGDYVSTSLSEIRLTYLIGELHRQLDNYAKALYYFSKVVEHPLRANEPQTVRMARDQWQNMREKMKQQEKKVNNKT